ncbi:MAG: cobalamin biosynthesis protein [Pseudomonadota bacterium]
MTAKQITRRSASMFSLTDAGQVLSDRLINHLPAGLQTHRPDGFIDAAQKAFTQRDVCIFICSTGIVIRSLAPVLKDKYTDPPVIAVSEDGRYVVPLLSGHEGGAIAIAARIASILNAQLVSTTASDYRYPVYAMGMGCDRGCPLDVLQSLVAQCISKLSADAEISVLASIEIKQNEPGLLQLGADLGIPFEVHSTDLLRTVESHLSEKSDVVFREVGVYGVAEAAALISAQQLTGQPAELVLPKHKNTRSTLAVARSYMPGF